MKRLIKFRALLDEKWYYSDSQEDAKALGAKLGGSCMAVFMNRFYATDTLSEYTGHKDKAGIEIYEGDICECRMVGIDTHIEIVTTQVDHNHLASAFAFTVIGNESDYRLFGFNSKDILSVQIIGNIFENPELLKYER